MKTIPCIFNENDIIIQQEIVEMKSYAIPLAQWDSGKQFFSINPVKRINDNRKRDNIAVMKNFLFESDTMPIEDQKQLLKKNKGVISMATFSGNKSIHFIIQVLDMPTTIDEYHYVWNELRNKYFPHADAQCNDCIRLSRTPGAVRDNGKKQVLILNTLQPIELNWRPLFNKINELKIMSMDYRKTIPITRKEFLTYEGQCVLNGEYPKGERDEIIRIGLPFLFYNGYKLEEILENNMSVRNNPQSISAFYHKLESGFSG